MMYAGSVKLFAEAWELVRHVVFQLSSHAKRCSRSAPYRAPKKLKFSPWAKFIYVGKETRFITKIFKNTNVKVTFTTDNTIENLLATRHKLKINMENVTSTN